MPDASTLPGLDATLAALLAAWGYQLDARQRVTLTKLDAELRNEIDRVVKYPMAQLRRLVGSRGTQQELRSILERHFERPRIGRAE
jgi:hypothetical protein